MSFSQSEESGYGGYKGGYGQPLGIPSYFTDTANNLKKTVGASIAASSILQVLILLLVLWLGYNWWKKKSNSLGRGGGGGGDRIFGNTEL
jgi:hypothetical protein